MTDYYIIRSKKTVKKKTAKFGMHNVETIKEKRYFIGKQKFPIPPHIGQTIILTRPKGIYRVIGIGYTRFVVDHEEIKDYHAVVEKMK